MTTFNTGNPIGSTDARDLSDNAENFDKALGTLDATWVDRLGVTRDSFEGRLEKGSFYRVGTFSAGYTLTNMRQTLEYSGHEYSWAGTFPKVVAAGTTPETSGGIGAGAWVDRTDVTLRTELSTSSGATLAGFSHDNEATSNTVSAKLKQIVSITDHPFSAVSGSDSTVAIDAAAAAAQFVFVPEGHFISTNVSLPYWKFFGFGSLRVANTLIELSPYPQNGNTCKFYKERTFGNYENAAGESVTINLAAGQSKENTQLMGATTDYIASNYKSFDHVGRYTAASSYEAVKTTPSSTTFTSNSITAPEITVDNVKVGMYLWYPDATGYIGKVQSVTNNTAIVDGWFIWGTGANATPASPATVAVHINPNTKIWTKNANLFLPASGDANEGVGFELGLVINKPGAGAGTWGFDVITLGSESPYAHYISRGVKTHGYLSLTNGQYGFASEGSVVGFESRDPKGFHYRALVSGVAKFSVDHQGYVSGDYRNTYFNGALPLVDITPTLASIVNVYTGAAFRLEVATAAYAYRHITVVAQATTIIKRNDGTTLKTIAAGTTGVIVCDGSFWY